MLTRGERGRKSKRVATLREYNERSFLHPITPSPSLKNILHEREEVSAPHLVSFDAATLALSLPQPFVQVFHPNKRYINRKDISHIYIDSTPYCDGSSVGTLPYAPGLSLGRGSTLSFFESKLYVGRPTPTNHMTLEEKKKRTKVSCGNRRVEGAGEKAMGERKDGKCELT